MFVGIDVHKDTHTAVGITPFGEKLFELTVGNYENDFRTLQEKVEAVGIESGLSPYFGLEDCHGYGERLAAFLVETKHPVVNVPPIMVDDMRDNETHPEKSDSLDAFGVAEVMLRKSDKLLPYTVTDESKKSKQIKDISMDREYLVDERARLKNQLHMILYRLWNNAYCSTFKDPFALKALRYWACHIPKGSDPFLVRTMKRKVKRLLQLHEEITELEKELATLINESGHTIHTANGCGIVLAAEIVGEVGDINRFHSPSSLAKYCGCSPRECSSGKSKRYKKTNSGNRRLNHARWFTSCR